MSPRHTVGWTPCTIDCHAGSRRRLRGSKIWDNSLICERRPAHRPRRNSRRFRVTVDSQKRCTSFTLAFPQLHLDMPIFIHIAANRDGEINVNTIRGQSAFISRHLDRKSHLSNQTAQKLGWPSQPRMSYLLSPRSSCI
jgi:hypothetical protein